MPTKHNTSVTIYSRSSPGKFAQETPRFVCRNLSRRLEAARIKGYLPKCRNWRCSQDCNKHMAHKHAVCEARALQQAGLPVFSGNLMMSAGATPADHRRTKRAFLQLVRRRAARLNHTVELSAVLHVRPDAAHWDIVLYSTMAFTPLHALIGESWRRSGGGEFCLKPVSEPAIVAAVKYGAKDVRREAGQGEEEQLRLTPDTLKVNRTPHYLPANRGSAGYLQATWHTAGFWGGRKPEAYWQEAVSEWRAAGLFETGQGEEEQLRLTPEPPYIPGTDPERDRREMLYRLPKVAAEAPTVRQIADMWGLGTAAARSLLIGLPGAVRIDGGGEWGQYDRYWHDPFRVSINIRTNEGRQTTTRTTLRSEAA